MSRYLAACRAIDRAAERRHLPQLYGLLANGRDFIIREAVAVPVARLDGVNALRRLLAAARSNLAEGHDNDGLENTIIGVVERDRASAAPVLAEMLASDQADDRADAASLWGWLAPAEPDRLFAAVKDRSPDVRANALGSLASFKSREDVFTALLDGLRDEQPSVRASAVSALTYYGDPRVLASLDTLADDPDAGVRQTVLDARRRIAPGRPRD